MRSNRNISLALAMFISVGCEWPFRDAPTDESTDLLALNAVYAGRRMADTLHLEIEWAEITVEYFQHYLIERKNITKHEDDWKLIATIEEATAHAFVDTIDDDATYHYRVSLIDINDEHLSSETSVTIRQTTRLTFPLEADSLHHMFDGDLIDDGDTVIVLAGDHQINPLHFGERHITLIAPSGAAETILSPYDSVSLDNLILSLITAKHGLIEGFSIIKSYGEKGGGVWLGDDALMRQCFIGGNRARVFLTPRFGYGGGLVLGGTSRLENCIVFRNIATVEGDGIQILPNSDVSIINCVVYGNEGAGLTDASWFSRSTGGATVINTIFSAHEKGNIPIYITPDSTLTKASYSNVGGIYVDPTSRYYDSTNFDLSDQFLDVDANNFRLITDSPFIDGGDPSDEYNDVDGSRNDLGAFGGPGGEWAAPIDLLIEILPYDP